MLTGHRSRARHVCGLITLACGPLLCVTLTPARPVHAATTAPIALACYDGDGGDYSGLARLDRDHITHLAPSGLYLAADGGLHEVGDPKTLVVLAHASDVKVFPMVQNYRDGAFQGGDLKLLASASGWQTLVTEVVQAVIDAGGDGVNLDFEQLSPTLTAPFVSFVAQLYGRLHAAGKGMIVDIPVDHRSYDVPRLQGVTDWLLLMAYDQHNLPGRPGPIAAYPWVQAALQQLRQEAVPRKVLLGLAGYGYDWGRGTVEPLSFSQVMQRAGSASVIQWDATAREPWYSYTASDHVRHTVWFSDAASLQPLIREAAALGLAGVGLWRTGLEDEGLWQVVARSGGSVPANLSVITIRPSLSGQGEVAGVAGFQKEGHRSVAMDAAGDRVTGERYLDLPAGIQLRETPLRHGTVAPDVRRRARSTLDSSHPRNTAPVPRACHLLRDRESGSSTPRPVAEDARRGARGGQSHLHPCGRPLACSRLAVRTRTEHDAASDRGCYRALGNAIPVPVLGHAV